MSLYCTVPSGSTSLYTLAKTGVHNVALRSRSSVRSMRLSLANGSRGHKKAAPVDRGLRGNAHGNPAVPVRAARSARSARQRL